MTDKRQISKSRLITTKHNTKNESFSCTHPSRNESFEQRRADKKCARDTQTIIASQWLFKYFICFDDIWFWYGLGVRVWIYVAGAFLKEKKKTTTLYSSWSAARDVRMYSKWDSSRRLHQPWHELPWKLFHFICDIFPLLDVCHKHSPSTKCKQVFSH